MCGKKNTFTIFVTNVLNTEEMFFFSSLLGNSFKCITTGDKLPTKIDGILCSDGKDISPEVIKRLKSPCVVQLLSSGTDRVPKVLKKKNVKVLSNSGVNSRKVAEMALAMFFAAEKKLIYHTAMMSKGIWDRRKIGNSVIGNRNIGIIGLGHVGKELAKIFKLLGMRVFAINRSGEANIKIDYIGTLSDLDYLLKHCDCIIICLSLTEETRGIITRKELRKMKRNAILINIARAEIVNQRDLYYHLKNNKEFIACIDVWEKYTEKEYTTALFQKYPFHTLPNVIMSPYIAGYLDKKLKKKILKMAAKNIKEFLRR